MAIEAKNNHLLFLFCSLLVSGLPIDALSYDYNFSLKCLANPQKPQYGGGIVVNPEIDSGLKGWTAFGDVKIEQRVSKEGNMFIAALHRNQPYDSFSQEFYLEKGKFYTFSAWVQVSEGNAKVAAMFKTPSGFERAGWAVAESRCWSMLKGGLTVNASGPSQLYFESKNTSVEIWADSISLQPFTREQWRSHHHQSIEKTRKSSVKLLAVDAKGNPLANTTVAVTQNRPNVPLGCAMSNHILSNPAYQKWFTARFTVTTFENEMKWDSTERSRGKDDYSVPDAMLQFAQKNNVKVRGHNVVWNDPKYLPAWALSLSPNDFRLAVDRRINSVVKRYAGQVIAWDVVNENMHFDFLESMLGKNASATLFKKVNQIDPRTPLFLNEFNTIEEVDDDMAKPAKYLEKIQEIRSGGYNGPLGIGLESHFSTPNIPYMRASMDKLAATGLPIWLTEVDVSGGSNQASYLEQVLREGHAHPSVKGIVVWSAWSPQGCYRMCLTDNNFKNLPTGDVVDKLLREWGQSGFSGTTDSNGQFQTRLFHGDYKFTVTHPNRTDFSAVAQNFEVVSREESHQKTILHVKVST
ncbi:endo-1,4-beta-xylanase 5-like [Actinidia eriantha]|uniref:endo-1,4-beta-xylanase 5-like n=1 Tax=Actinidia eriantha TaxID=165200 RepID=UPI00258F9D2A|nr:endo-1,4-beta-xylanase 5-like [Actinidia eriantha]